MERESEQRSVRLIYLALALVTFALFAPVLGDEFITYDDHSYVVENAHIQNGVTPATLAWAFTTGRSSNWHPLTWISHMVDWQLYGLKHPGGHHLTSLLFHIANSLLLFAVMRRMSGALWRSAVVAALFAWHPLHVESVAWISERKDMLSAFFWLLTMLAYARYVEESKVQSPRSRVVYCLTLLFFVLGLLSKPMVVTLPFVLLLLDVWPLKRVAWFAAREPGKAAFADESSDVGTSLSPSPHPSPQGESRGGGEGAVLPPVAPNTRAAFQLILEKIPFFALAAISSVVTFLVQRGGGAVMNTDLYPLKSRIVNALIAYAAYLEKTFWPSGLAIFYPWRLEWPLYQVLASVLLLLAVSAVAIRCARARPWLLIGWLWYLGTLVPVIGLVQVGSQAMADRYTYLPLIGILFAAVWSIAEIFSKGAPGFPRAAWWVFAPALVLCLILSRTQLAYWKNTVTLFRRDLVVAPNNSIAHFNLAKGLDEMGRTNEGGAEFAAALAANPNAPIALLGNGRHFADLGDETNAMKYYLAALHANPSYGDAHFDLANLLARQGKYAEAAEHFAAVLRTDPEAADAHNNLGAVLMRLAQPEKAMEQFQEALRWKPDFPEAQDQLGSVLLKLNHDADAQIHFAEAVRLKPDFVHARLKLGLLLAQRGHFEEATAQFQAVLKLEPQNAEAAYDLAAVFAAQDRLDDAAQMFAASARLRPNDPDPRVRLAAILTAQGKFEPAIEAYRDVLKLKPDEPEGLKGLAWILATASKPELRNGAEAVRLAEHADALTGHKQPAVLAALDAAYAEAGRFDDAIKAAQDTQKIALAQDRKDIADAAAKRIELYRAGKPFHQESPH